MHARLEALIAGRNIDDGDVSEPKVETKEEEESIAVTPGECQYCRKNAATPGLPTLLLSTQ